MPVLRGLGDDPVRDQALELWSFGEGGRPPCARLGGRGTTGVAFVTLSYRGVPRRRVRRPRSHRRDARADIAAGAPAGGVRPCLRAIGPVHGSHRLARWLRRDDDRPRAAARRDADRVHRAARRDAGRDRAIRSACSTYRRSLWPMEAVSRLFLLPMATTPCPGGGAHARPLLVVHDQPRPRGALRGRAPGVAPRLAEPSSTRQRLGHVKILRDPPPSARARVHCFPETHGPSSRASSGGRSVFAPATLADRKAARRTMSRHRVGVHQRGGGGRPGSRRGDRRSRSTWPSRGQRERRALSPQAGAIFHDDVSNAPCSVKRTTPDARVPRRARHHETQRRWVPSSKALISARSSSGAADAIESEKCCSRPRARRGRCKRRAPRRWRAARAWAPTGPRAGRLSRDKYVAAGRLGLVRGPIVTHRGAKAELLDLRGDSACGPAR